MSTNKYFKCPYCEKRLTRTDMVIHIEKNHLEELPEGFTPLRATFHAVNRKDFSYRRPCRVCKGPTEWDESKGRYDQLCKKEQCHGIYVEKMRRDMGDKLGINRQTKSAEGLEKMLANRKISGRYKFQNGDELTYTGSYEKKALQFFDQVLNVKAEDLMVPGPPLYYTLDGKKHIYIPDMYYIPYNLIIEVKDGGDKPNTNPVLKETRRKMLAKEKFVIEETDYNYIRLTNNDFSQLLSIFADLKMSLIESDEKKPQRIIHVNESMVSTIQATIPMRSENDVVVVNYMQNNVFSGKSRLAIANNPKFDRIFKEDEYSGKLIETDKKFLENCVYNTYIVHDCKQRIVESVYSNLNKNIDQELLYKMIFGHERYSEDQIEFEENCEPYKDYYCNLVEINENIKQFIKGETNGQ